MKALDVRKPLTTGQVARILVTSVVTVRKWIEDGLLKASSFPGGSRSRVTHSDLRAFLKRNKMPTDRLDAFEESGWAAIEDTEPESE